MRERSEIGRVDLFDFIDAVHVRKLDRFLLEGFELCLAWHGLHQTGAFQEDGEDDQEDYTEGVQREISRT